mmetsp:Transcript_5792/g.16247  ORF Transcript_5792/g.16247 Transcript_5792/m.16247 type:complete len:334 (+) Transcript_5792:59-1060(+)
MRVSQPICSLLTTKIKTYLTAQCQLKSRTGIFTTVSPPPPSSPPSRERRGDTAPPFFASSPLEQEGIVHERCITEDGGIVLGEIGARERPPGEGGDEGRLDGDEEALDDVSHVDVVVLLIALVELAGLHGRVDDKRLQRGEENHELDDEELAHDVGLRDAGQVVHGEVQRDEAVHAPERGDGGDQVNDQIRLLRRLGDVDDHEDEEEHRREVDELVDEAEDPLEVTLREDLLIHARMEEAAARRVRPDLAHGQPGEVREHRLLAAAEQHDERRELPERDGLVQLDDPLPDRPRVRHEHAQHRAARHQHGHEHDHLVRPPLRATLGILVSAIDV